MSNGESSHPGASDEPPKAAIPPEPPVTPIAEPPDCIGKLGNTSKLDLDTLVQTEYSQLRTEIKDALTESANLEKIVVGATGAVWAWLLLHPAAPPIAWWIPILFVVLGGVRALALYRSVRMAARYIAARESETRGVRPAAKIEKKARIKGVKTIVVEEVQGWESYRNTKSAGVLITAIVFWALLALLVVGAALLHTKPRCVSPASPWSAC